MRASFKNARHLEPRRRGSALIEFTLVGTFIFLPLLAGLASVGMNMVTAMQAANLNSSAGQMFSAGWDFTQPVNQSMLQAMAGTLQTSTSGGGVVILSEVQYTTNAGYVCIAQTTITIGVGGNGGQSKYEPGCADNGSFAGLMAPTVNGQIAYLAETYYNNPAFTWAFAPAGTGTGIYEVAIF
jgi:hypothetical protein